MKKELGWMWCARDFEVTGWPRIVWRNASSRTLKGGRCGWHTWKVLLCKSLQGLRKKVNRPQKMSVVATTIMRQLLHCQSCNSSIQSSYLQINISHNFFNPVTSSGTFDSTLEQKKPVISVTGVRLRFFFLSYPNFEVHSMHLMVTPPELT